MSISIDTSKITAPSIYAPESTGNETEAINDATAKVTSKAEDLRVSIANTLGISADQLGGSTSVSGVTKKATSLIEKYESVRNNITEESVLFDIYSVMNLIQEMSQKLRDAMRDLRKLENQVIQANITSQAQMQREAAICNLVASGVTAAVQTGVALYGMAKQLTALKTESVAKQTQGVDVAKQCMENAQSASVSQQMIDSKVETLASKNPQVANDVNAKFEAAKADGKNATAEELKSVDTNPEVVKANNDIQAAQTKLDDASSKVNVAQTKIDSIQTKIDAAQAKIDAIRNSDNGNFAEGVKATDELGAAQREMEAANGEMTAAKAEQTTAQQTLDTAKTAKTTAQENAVSEIRNEASTQKLVDDATIKYNKALEKANVERNQNGKVSKETQAELEQAGNELVYTTAKQVQMLRGNTAGASKVETIKGNLTDSFDTKSKLAAVDGNKSTKALVYGQMASQISQILGGVGQSIGQTVAEYRKAAATQMQANQKASEDQLDQIKELLQQMLSTIEKVISLYQSVAQKESQTIEDIAGAIKG